MNCKLCDQTKPLIDAHVIPKSFHRIYPTDKQPSRLFTNAVGEYNSTIPKGVYDKTIVCEDCERTFSTWDDYANKLFIESWDSFKSIDSEGKEEGYYLEHYDYKKLKLFFMSVLWRATVSSHIMFRNIDLGPKEPRLRKAIQNSDAGDVDFFGVVLQAFNETNIGILNPHPQRFDGLRYYRFYMSHIIAYIKVDSQPFGNQFRSIALGAEKQLLIVSKNFRNSPERKIMRNMVM